MREAPPDVSRGSQDYRRGAISQKKTNYKRTRKKKKENKHPRFFIRTCSFVLVEQKLKFYWHHDEEEEKARRYKAELHRCWSEDEHCRRARRMCVRWTCKIFAMCVVFVYYSPAFSFSPFMLLIHTHSPFCGFFNARTATAMDRFAKAQNDPKDGGGERGGSGRQRDTCIYGTLDSVAIQLMITFYVF